MRAVGEATESGRVGRAAGALTLGASLVGVIWGLTLAIWSAVGTDATGATAGLPVRGWAGGLLIGLLCGAGTAVTLLIPVLMAAALTGSWLERSLRRQQLAGLVVAGVGLAVAVGAQYWLVMDWAMVLEITWPAALLALALGAIAGPFVVDGRLRLPRRGAAGS